MENFNLLYFSIIIPIFSLLALFYRLIIFKQFDLQIVIFGIVLGAVPLVNLIVLVPVLFLFIADMLDTPKALALDSNQLEKFALERTSGDGNSNY
jgi:hypothetical protein